MLCSGIHQEGNQCVSNTSSCTITNGTGVKYWAGSSYGDCTVKACNMNYHREDNLCLSNTKSCSIENGLGVQYWVGESYGQCTVASCNVGFHPSEGNQCLSNSLACATSYDRPGVMIWNGSSNGTCEVPKVIAQKVPFHVTHYGNGTSRAIIYLSSNLKEFAVTIRQGVYTSGPPSCINSMSQLTDQVEFTLPTQTKDFFDIYVCATDSSQTIFSEPLRIALTTPFQTTTGNYAGLVCEVVEGDMDSDYDLVGNSVDSCPTIKNSSQDDNDKDGIGDACELDTAKDGVIDDLDNCLSFPNEDQVDSNKKGIGDVCEGRLESCTPSGSRRTLTLSSVPIPAEYGPDDSCKVTCPVGTRSIQALDNPYPLPKIPTGYWYLNLPGSGITESTVDVYGGGVTHRGVCREGNYRSPLYGSFTLHEVVSPCYFLCK